MRKWSLKWVGRVFPAAAILAITILWLGRQQLAAGGEAVMHAPVVIRSPQGTVDLSFVPFATGLAEPVDIANAEDDRLFVVERQGTIRVVEADGTVLETPFLDIDDRVGSAGSEQGLLGLAFHPDYASNGYFYVNYTNNSGDTRVSRFSRDPSDPNLADPNSELILLGVDQPYSNHNGGDLNFGPDGYLYIGLGDGGSGGDPGNRAQDPLELLGKMLRIDVDPAGGNPPDCGTGNNYSIPPDNPLVGVTGCDEIWALGVRNPWRFSFDRLTGEMFIGDVGQESWEEVSYQPAASVGGENYGWRCYEGFHPYNLQGCGQPEDYVFPAIEYSSGGGGGNDGCAITGGFVYRGGLYPNLYGVYVFSDYCSSNFWTLVPDGSGGWTLTLVEPTVGFNPSTFGESAAGELYVADLYGGTIYHVEE
ncbi:MAG: PQQ-dependent sugar dehydrogenase, partial [Chloroflexota bacterium]